jgi:uncharacterized membrane protein
MADAPVQLIVAAFQDETGADSALAALKEAKKEKLIDIKNSAVLRKNAKGELSVHEAKDMTGARGGVLGGAAAAGLGILTGGASVALVGLGAGVGALAAKLRDSGFKDERLRKLGDSLKPGSSAIVAVVEHTWVTDLREELEKAGAEVLVEAIAADVAEQLGKGNEVAYTAIGDSEGGMAARVVAGPEGGAPQAGSGSEGETKQAV